MAGGMNFPGMEGMSQKEMKKACKKMMKQWSQMMNMMATGRDFKREILIVVVVKELFRNPLKAI